MREAPAKARTHPIIRMRTRRPMVQMDRKVAAAKEREGHAREDGELDADDTGGRGGQGAAVKNPYP